MEASHRRESLKMASDHSGGPCQVRGRKTSAEWRAATWRIGPQWGVCRGLGDLKPPHSILRCLFMPLARSPVLCLCSYSEQVGWVTQLLCSGLSLAISPFSSSSCSLPPLFFFALSLLLSPYSPFNLYCISWSICALSVLGWTDKHWLGFGGGGWCREEEEQRRRVGVWEICLLFSVL